MLPIDLLCWRCAHFTGDETRGLTCKAFPGTRIPEEIIGMEFEHTKPYPGDNGLLFEPLEKEPDKKEPGQ